MKTLMPISEDVGSIPGSTAESCFSSMQILEAVVMTQIAGLLTPTWETWVECLIPAFSPVTTASAL